jgi:hypothetical protein
MKRVAPLVMLSLLPVLAGCATMVRGTDQEVAVNTTPNAAEVQFSNGQSCTSPCRVKAERNKSLIVTISKEACHTETATMVPTLAGAGVILGGLIDYGTGAVYDLQPNPLTVTLVCDGSAAASQPPAEPAHVVDNPQEKGPGGCAVMGTPHRRSGLRRAAQRAQRLLGEARRRRAIPLRQGHRRRRPTLLQRRRSEGEPGRVAGSVRQQLEAGRGAVAQINDAPEPAGRSPGS